MRRIVVSLYKYKPSVASTIRVVAYIKSFLKQGYYVTLVTTSEEQIDLKDDKLKIVLFKESTSKSSALNRIINDFRLVNTTKRASKDTDVIYSYTIPLFGLLYSKKWNVFYEETEVPLYGATEDFVHRLSRMPRVYGIKRAKGLIVISRALKEYYVGLGIDSKKIIVSNMIVDPARFEGLVKQDVSERYIAYCGSVNSYKDGVDDLIKAFSIVSQQINDIYLYIIGKFEQRDDEIGIKKLVSSYGLRDKVLFTGEVKASEIPQLLKNAECLVLARPDSRQAKYGFPTKLGEYLLSGNPVVVTKVGEIPLFLEDRQGAFLARPGNVDSIASCIFDALTLENAESIGRAGCEVAKQNFNSEIESLKVTNFFINRVQS